MTDPRDSYSYGSQAPSYGYGGPNVNGHTQQGPTLRHRHVDENPPTHSKRNGKSKQKKSTSLNVKRLDFMFPKVDTEFTVRTDRGGVASLVAFGLIALLALAESFTWMGQNRATTEHISVDTSLGKRMRVNMNITFPGLACEDLHVDVMDVAGDSHLNVEQTMKKTSLNVMGRPFGKTELVESNKHRQEQEEKELIMKEKVPENYCGPCYGAHEADDQCCNTCDDLVEAYRKKKWNSVSITLTAEQCVREGRDKKEPKLMKKGEGCNLEGFMTVNRVAGNFHIAMGEGVERNGRHIHTFAPDDTPNFNASHIIHDLSFGPTNEAKAEESFLNGVTSLNGITKIVTREHGTTGLFQYFIKIVPTTYVGKGKQGDVVETNRYFFTERFRPLMNEYLEDEDFDEEVKGKAVANAGHSGTHSNQDHHHVKNSILPGVFFIYEIYPFAVEISENNVPFTHLLIRLMATVGGVLTVVRLADTLLFERVSSRQRQS